MKCKALLLSLCLCACAPSLEKQFEEATQLYQAQDYKQAILMLEELRVKDTGNINIYPKLTIAYAETGDWDKCVSTGKTAIEKGADFFEIYAQVIQCNFQQQNIPEALQYYNEALEKYPNRKDFGDEIGSNLLKYQQYKPAIEILRPLAEASEKNEKFSYYTGLAYEKIQDYANAEKYYKRALEINNQHSNSFYGLGSIYENQNKLPEAMVQYAKAIEYDSDHLSALLNLAQIQEKQAPEKALETWKLYILAAEAKDPNSEFLTHAKSYVKKAEGGT